MVIGIMETLASNKDIRLSISDIVRDCNSCYKDIISRLARLHPTRNAHMENTTGTCLVCMNWCTSSCSYDIDANCSKIICGVCVRYVESRILNHLLHYDKPPADITQDYIDQLHVRVQQCRARACRAYAYMHIARMITSTEWDTYHPVTCDCCNENTVVFVRYTWKTGDTYQVHYQCKTCHAAVRMDMQLVYKQACFIIFAGRLVNCVDVPMVDDVHVAIFGQVRAVVCDDAVAIL